MKKLPFYYGYVIVIACFAIQAIGIGTYVTFGIFFKPLIADFGWSRAELSGAHALAILIMGFLGMFVGKVNDRIGPRIVMLVTGCLFGLGFILMSNLRSLWQLYLFYGIVVGMGMSSTDVIALTTTTRWFVRRRGRMTGIVKVGTGTGQFTIPLAVSILIASYGWRNAYVVIGVIGMILLIAVGQLLRRDPTQMGLLPDGDEKIDTGGSELEEKGFFLHEALRDRQFWMICWANLAVVFCFMVVILHIVPYATDVGISPGRAAGIISTIGGVSMVGRFMTGFAIDLFGNRRTMVLCLILLLSVLLWVQLARELWMLYLFAVVYGCAHGGFYTVISPMVAEYFGVRSHGVLFGIVAFSGTVGGAVGPLLAGHVFDITGSYSLAFWICIAVGVMGLGLILSLGQKKIAS